MVGEAFLLSEHISVTQWNHCTQILPKVKELVLVFRYEKKKYVVAYRIENSSEEEKENTHNWVTQYSLCYPINDDDLWINFPYVRTEKLYD